MIDYRTELSSKIHHYIENPSRYGQHRLNPTGKSFKDRYERPPADFPILGYAIDGAIIRRYGYFRNYITDEYPDKALHYAVHRDKALLVSYEEPEIFHNKSIMGHGENIIFYDIVFRDILGNVVSVEYDMFSCHYVFAWDTPQSRQALVELKLISG